MVYVLFQTGDYNSKYPEKRIKGVFDSFEKADKKRRMVENGIHRFSIETFELNKIYNWNF